MIELANQKDAKWIDLFLDVIEKAYLGSDFQYGNQTFRLKPTLVTPADFYKRTFDSSLTSYESLLKALDPTFKSIATSEVYRVRTGWVARALKGHNGRIIRRVIVGKDIFLIPNLSKQPSVGIDTSGCGDNDSVIVICTIPDYEDACIWLERHLELPRDHVNNELHWSKLNRVCRDRVLSKFELTLSICCDSLLVIKTNALNIAEAL